MLNRRRSWMFSFVFVLAALVASTLLPALGGGMAYAQSDKPVVSGQRGESPSAVRYQYRCVSLGMAMSPSSAVKKANKKLTEMADKGWRLTESTMANGIACFERRRRG